VTEWFEVYKWPAPPKLAVARGPTVGDWTLVAYAPDRLTAEAVLARWRREYPQQVVALLRDGQVIEDAQTKAERLARYRRLAERFREGFLERS
jgi:hypothetical protein